MAAASLVWPQQRLSALSVDIRVVAAAWYNVSASDTSVRDQQNPKVTRLSGKAASTVCETPLLILDRMALVLVSSRFTAQRPRVGAFVWTLQHMRQVAKSFKGRRSTRYWGPESGRRAQACRLPSFQQREIATVSGIGEVAWTEAFVSQMSDQISKEFGAVFQTLSCRMLVFISCKMPSPCKIMISIFVDVMAEHRVRLRKQESLENDQ
jgi:hypothetical protein